MNNTDTLFIFAANPVPGKVKIRLSASMGDEAALIIYNSLLRHMDEQIRQLRCRKVIYYRDFIPETDAWSDPVERSLQQGANPGEKLVHAFEEQFHQSPGKVVFAASDYPGLSREILLSAFDQLDHHDVVIGPAEDGDYYLLGMNRLLPGIFTGIPWGTPYVLNETLERCRDIHRHYFLLPRLYDVDELKDLEYLSHYEV